MADRVPVSIEELMGDVKLKTLEVSDTSSRSVKGDSQLDTGTDCSHGRKRDR